jgi:hypothetical protein
MLKKVMQERRSELADKNIHLSLTASGRSFSRAALSCTGGRAPTRGADWGLKANRDLFLYLSPDKSTRSEITLQNLFWLVFPAS